MAPKRTLHDLYNEYDEIYSSSKRQKLNDYSYIKVGKNIIDEDCNYYIYNRYDFIFLSISYIIINDEKGCNYISCNVILFRISIIYFDDLDYDDSDYDDSDYDDSDYDDSDYDDSDVESVISDLTYNNE